MDSVAQGDAFSLAVTKQGSALAVPPKVVADHKTTYAASPVLNASGAEPSAGHVAAAEPTVAATPGGDETFQMYSL